MRRPTRVQDLTDACPPQEANVRLVMHDRVHVAEAHRHQTRWPAGRAYRAGRLVCACVQVTISLDDRLGLTERERRRVRVSFHEPLDDDLRSELTKLMHRRGAAARRIADASQTIAVIVTDHDSGPLRIVGQLQPPEARHAPLREIEFGLREPAP
jgi:hypothetical protein